ncbi:hypothetical protein EG68_11533 [Paragonimus skrjabini miyazakii]|uniref:Uncharacterized protein n=1 Tax=Paragonimus skrjabini miyazakii TaxID=59628 RepID=A0A8S9YNV6_9TREM|nr:hypothetical protein EG68_11533 [Paragonimus skrjabini miyazakii]
MLQRRPYQIRRYCLQQQPLTTAFDFLILIRKLDQSSEKLLHEDHSEPASSRFSSSKAMNHPTGRDSTADLQPSPHYDTQCLVTLATPICSRPLLSQYCVKQDC